MLSHLSFPPETLIIVAGFLLALFVLRSRGRAVRTEAMRAETPRNPNRW